MLPAGPALCGTHGITIMESNGKLSHLFIPGKTAALVPEYVVKDLSLQNYNLGSWFAVKDLPLYRTATLVSWFTVEDLPLGRTATLVPEFELEDLGLPSAELQTWFLCLQ